MSKKVISMYDAHLPTLLLSIRTPFVEDIKSNKKIIEYRKKYYNGPTQAFIYSSGLDKTIELFVKFDTPIIDDSEFLASLGLLIQNDDPKGTTDYFQNKSGYALPIIEYATFKRIHLQEFKYLFPKVNPPQSYLSLDNDDKKPVLDYLLQRNIIEKQQTAWLDNYKKFITK